VIVEWKHRKAESEVEPLLVSAARLDPALVRSYPRPVRDIVAATLPVAFESRRELTTKMVVEVLGDVYAIDHRDLQVNGDGPLAGYTFARGDTAVIFSDPQYGDGFERFTLAHEAAHLAVEYLPLLRGSRQAELFGGTPAPAFFARRDPLGHIFVGAGKATGTSDMAEQYARLRSDRNAWLREVVANACAAELLAPHREVSRLLASNPAVTDRRELLQSFFGLSRRAAEVRLADLGLAPPVADDLLFVLG
jgi:Zn-dependent peptidase ImmA (M78 family)